MRARHLVSDLTIRYANLTLTPADFACHFYKTTNLSAAFAETDRYIASLPLIRVLLDNAPNNGNQAASSNWMKRMDFKNIVEVVYPESIREIVSQTFTIHIPNQPVYVNSAQQIKFITTEKFAELRAQGQVQPCKLGITGALDGQRISELSNAAKDKLILTIPGFNNSNANNFHALFLNAYVFIWPSPYHGDHAGDKSAIRIDTKLEFQDDEQVAFIDKSRYQALLPPVATLSEAELFLRQQSIGKGLVKQQPGLMDLIAEMKKGTKNILPIYGWTTRDYPHNLFNIIAGARFAQQNPKMARPLIITCYYEMKMVQHKLSLHEYLNDDFFTLLADATPYEEQIIQKIQYDVRPLNLANTVKFATLKDANLKLSMKQLKSNEALVIFIPPLPKNVFDGMYAYQAKNILAPVREGASTLSTLLTTGRPHIHCSSGNLWEINLDSATPAARLQLKAINKYACDVSFSNWFANWAEINVAEFIGNYLVTAKNPDSDLSKFFVQLKQDMLRPEMDRIQTSLLVASKLSMMPAQERHEFISSFSHSMQMKTYYYPEEIRYEEVRTISANITFNKPNCDGTAAEKISFNDDEVQSLDAEDIVATFKYAEEQHPADTSVAIESLYSTAIMQQTLQSPKKELAAASAKTVAPKAPPQHRLDKLLFGIADYCRSFVGNEPSSIAMCSSNSHSFGLFNQSNDGYSATNTCNIPRLN